MIELLLEAERAFHEGRLAEAERRYEQVVGSDPPNAIAMVGLARVALARDDDDAAATYIDRALATDPENVAARRFAAELGQHAGAGDALSSAAMPPAPRTTSPTPAPSVAQTQAPAWTSLLRRLLGRR